MVKLVINGFDSVAQATAFFDWYSNSGEQSAAYTFEEMQHEGDLDTDFIEAVGSVTVVDSTTVEGVVKPHYEAE